MKNEDFEFIVSSDHRYEEMVVEIYYQEMFVARLSKDNGPENVLVEFPSSISGTEENCVKSMGLNEYKEALDFAHQALLEG